MSVLIPVRFPLNDANRSAIRKGGNLVADDTNPELVIIHVNRLQQDEHVSRSDLRTAVEAEFGQLPAHYVVRDGFLYEEAVLNEAVRHDVDHVVLSERRYGAWQRLVRNMLGWEVDLEAFLKEQIEAAVHVVPDSG